MTVHTLPLHIDPIKMADAGMTFSGELPADSFPELADLIAEFAAPVKVVLEFAVDFEGNRYLSGKLQADLTLICQRCLKPYLYKVDSTFCLSPVKSEKEAKHLPQHYEPLMLGDDILLTEIIQQELVLALPMVPMHDDAVCSAKPATAALKPANPFAKLAEMKEHLKK